MQCAPGTPPPPLWPYLTTPRTEDIQFHVCIKSFHKFIWFVLSLSYPTMKSLSFCLILCGLLTVACEYILYNLNYQPVVSVCSLLFEDVYIVQYIHSVASITPCSTNTITMSTYVNCKSLNKRNKTTKALHCTL